MLLREEIPDTALQFGKSCRFDFLSDDENEIVWLQREIGEAHKVGDRAIVRLHTAADCFRIV